MIEPTGIAGAIVALTVAVGGVMHMRRRISRDGVEIAKDRVAQTEVENLAAEVQRLRLKTTEDAGAIAGLKAENLYFSRELMRTIHLAEKYARGCKPEVRAFIETDFAGLDEAKGDKG